MTPRLVPRTLDLQMTQKKPPSRHLQHFLIVFHVVVIIGKQ